MTSAATRACACSTITWGRYASEKSTAVAEARTHTPACPPGSAPWPKKTTMSAQHRASAAMPQAMQAERMPSTLERVRA